MFSIGDRVVYGSMGVCTIIDRCMPDMPGATKECYVLVPEYVANSKIYAPVDGTTVNMRPLLSRRQVHALIDKIPDMDMLEPVKERQLQKENYRAVIQSADSTQLAQLLKTLHVRRKQGMEEKRSVPVQEKEHYDTVRRLLFGEIATTMEIQLDEVEDMISARLAKRGGSAFFMDASQA